MTKDKLHFGAWVDFNRTLVRRRVKDSQTGHWDRKEWRRSFATTLRRGIYIGWRTLANGYRSWEDGIGWSFSPTDHLEAALVAYNPRRKPALVPFGALTEVAP